MSYGERVIGAVLTGELDDGTAGLWEVKRRAGITLVKNPEDADFPSMPLSALRDVEVDYTVSLAEMGPLLGRLVMDDEGIGRAEKQKAEKTAEANGNDMEPQLIDMTCPDCRGNIWEWQRGNGKEYRCRVGHTFSPKSMLSEHYAAQEKALYGAIVMLEEGASLTLRLAGQFKGNMGDRLRDEARERELQARTLRAVLMEHRSFSLD
jgi:two-component system chemotaxis response regulator CheB